MEYWIDGAFLNLIIPSLHHSGGFSRALLLLDDAHGVLFSVARRPHGYKFVWSRYPHDRASPGRIAGPRRLRVGELRKNGAGYAVSPVSRFPLRERKLE